MLRSDDERVVHEREQPLELHERALFKGRQRDTLQALAACVESRSHCAGEKICRRGDTGYGLFLIRRGAVRIGLPLAPGQHHHLATSGRGASFGEVSFVDRDVRSADAIAHSDTDLYILPRERFDALAQDHRRLAFQLLYGLGSARSSGLRFANAELRALEHG